MLNLFRVWSVAYCSETFESTKERFTYVLVPRLLLFRFGMTGQLLDYKQVLSPLCQIGINLLTYFVRPFRKLKEIVKLFETLHCENSLERKTRTLERLLPLKNIKCARDSWKRTKLGFI